MCTEAEIQQTNEILDGILAKRRSHRAFTQQVPADDDIRRILHAGLLAPYAAAAVGNSHDYFRRFFVFRNGSPGMQAAIPLVVEEAGKMHRELDAAMKDNPDLCLKAAGFVSRLALFRKMGFVPGLGTAPFYVVVAERRGFPPVEAQSLAHCLENMWLKATALCLGFQIVSITSRMSENPAFCGILGIRPGEWELMGCAIGYPKEELPPSVRPPVEDVTAWIG